MKYILLLFVVCFLFLSYSNNPPLGKTLAPGEGFCGECHTSTGPTNGQIEISGIPTAVVLGTKYPISVTITNIDPQFLRAGFEMTILKLGSNQRAGTFSLYSDTIPTNTSIREQNSRQYLSHAPALFFEEDNTATYRAFWTADGLTTTDSFRVYASYVIANGNGANTGDRPGFYTSPVTLPLNFTSVSASAKSDGIHLQWETARAINVSHFDIEWSRDALHFESIGQKSFGLQSMYTFDHQIPGVGTNYYRIVSVDFDGLRTYSPIFNASFEKNGFPDPIISSGRIHFTAEVQGNYDIFSIDGQRILSGRLTEDIDISSLMPGIYILRLPWASSKFYMIQ